MKVTNQMIHKDVRLIGSILRKFTGGMTKVKRMTTKRAKVEKVYLQRPDGSQMRLMILSPRHEVSRVPAVL